MGKFDLERDAVSKFMEYSNLVLQPVWLQPHPDIYLHQVFKEYREKKKQLKQGENLNKPEVEEKALKHNCDELGVGKEMILN